MYIYKVEFDIILEGGGLGLQLYLHVQVTIDKLEVQGTLNW